jgi:hypothetical protein
VAECECYFIITLLQTNVTDEPGTVIFKEEIYTFLYSKTYSKSCGPFTILWSNLGHVSPENLKPKRGCRCSHLYSAQTHSGVHPSWFPYSQVKQPELVTRYLHLMPKIRISATPCLVFERCLNKNMDKLTLNNSVLRYIAPYSPFESQSMFRRNISPPFLRQANKSNKKPA